MTLCEGLALWHGAPLRVAVSADGDAQDCIERIFYAGDLLQRYGPLVLLEFSAPQVVMRGKSLKVVQELLGHATIEMTMRYSHLAPVVHRDAADALDGPCPLLSDSEDAIG